MSNTYYYCIMHVFCYETIVDIKPESQ